MTTQQRQPAIRKTHPAEDLPERPARVESPTPRVESPTPTAPQTSSPATPPHLTGEQAEGLTLTHNTRIRPTIKARLRRGVDKLRYETGDRTISEASITDKALEEYLDKHNL